MALFIAFGIISLSTIVALVRRRVSAGIRVFHYQLFAIAAAPCGVIFLGLTTRLFHLHLRHRHLILFGLIAGVGAGITLAFLFEHMVRAIYRRFKPFTL
jgi:hypothetical protein